MISTKSKLASVMRNSGAYSQHMMKASRVGVRNRYAYVRFT